MVRHAADEVQLAQIGIIVGFGVLLHTLLVRSTLVPALVSLLGERFWWPGHPGPKEVGQSVRSLAANASRHVSPGTWYQR